MDILVSSSGYFEPIQGWCKVLRVPLSHQISMG